MLNQVLDAFGLNADNCTIAAFGSGLINLTWKVATKDESYVLQRINTNIFKSPQAIGDNLTQLKAYLQLTSPDYLFVAPLSTPNGTTLVIHEGAYYRLLPFIKNSHTVDVVTSPQQAYEAARQFGKFARLLNGFDVSKLKYTLPDFHNLQLRIDQFNRALKTVESALLSTAANEIAQIKEYTAIADAYKNIIVNCTIPLRVIHHDTKINNVLFDEQDLGLCVIDLDTVMPGYFISDVGDMMRTYLSPVHEEEPDLNKIYIRTDNMTAIYQGYMDEMGNILTDAEKQLFFYSGRFMIYMQAVRFLTDYLNGDVYYQTSYPGQNLNRTKNQLTLLNVYCQSIK